MIIDKQKALIEALKQGLNVDNITYPHICRCDMDVSNIEVKIDNKPNPPMPKDYGELKIINHPKHIIVNGALYKKIDDSVLTIANGYGEYDMKLENGEIQLIDIPQELIDRIKIDSYNQALEDFFNKCLEEKIMFYSDSIECLREVKEQLKK